MLRKLFCIFFYKMQVKNAEILIFSGGNDFFRSPLLCGESKFCRNECVNSENILIQYNL